VGRSSIPQQAAAIPVRRNGAAFDVCLIRRRDFGEWGIPKGTIDPGDSSEETALKEALEEAGLSGRLLGGVVGQYEYKKWYSSLIVDVYVMEVLEEHTDWDEADIRERRWTSFAKTARLLRKHPVYALLDRAGAILTALSTDS